MRCPTGFGRVPAGAYEDILLDREVMSAGAAASGSAGRTDSPRWLLRVPGYALERRGRARKHHGVNRFVGGAASACKDIRFDPEVKWTDILVRGCGAGTQFVDAQADKYKDILLNTEAECAGLAALGDALPGKTRRCARWRTQRHPLRHRDRARGRRYARTRREGSFVGATAGVYLDVFLNPEENAEASLPLDALPGLISQCAC